MLLQACRRLLCVFAIHANQIFPEKRQRSIKKELLDVNFLFFFLFTRHRFLDLFIYLALSVAATPTLPEAQDVLEQRNSEGLELDYKLKDWCHGLGLDLLFWPGFPSVVPNGYGSKPIRYLFRTDYPLFNRLAKGQVPGF